MKKSVVNNQKRTQQFRVMADKKETIVNLVYWYVYYRDHKLRYNINCEAENARVS